MEISSHGLLRHISKIRKSQTKENKNYKFTKLKHISLMFRYTIKKLTLWDKLIFKNIQENMGGRLRLLVIGSAPLAGNILTFMRCALGCIVSITTHNPTILKH